MQLSQINTEIFTKGLISDVIVKDLKKFVDERGWLCELFRHDELVSQFYPAIFTNQTGASARF